MTASPTGDARRRQVLDAVFLAVGTVLAIFASVVVSGNEYVDADLPETVGSAAPDRYAAALLKDPHARREVGECWTELTEPETTSVQAGLMLGIEPEQPKRC